MNPSRHSRRGRFLSSCKLVLLQQHRHPVAERRLVLVARGPPGADGRNGTDRPPVPVDRVLRADQGKQDYSAHELHGAFASLNLLPFPSQLIVRFP